MEKFIKCTNGVRFRNVPERLFNSPAFARTEWRKVEEVELPPVAEAKVKQTKTKKVEDASGLLEEFEKLPI
jgi:hypothetical protein